MNLCSIFALSLRVCWPSIVVAVHNEIRLNCLIIAHIFGLSSMHWRRGQTTSSDSEIRRKASKSMVDKYRAMAVLDRSKRETGWVVTACVDNGSSFATDSQTGCNEEAVLATQPAPVNRETMGETLLPLTLTHPADCITFSTLEGNFAKVRRVRSGTLPALIKHLVSDFNRDPDLLDCFVLTYPTYCDVNAVIKEVPELLTPAVNTDTAPPSVGTGRGGTAEAAACTRLVERLGSVLVRIIVSLPVALHSQHSNVGQQALVASRHLVRTGQLGLATVLRQALEDAMPRGEPGTQQQAGGPSQHCVHLYRCRRLFLPHVHSHDCPCCRRLFLPHVHSHDCPCQHRCSLAHWMGVAALEALGAARLAFVQMSPRG